MSDNFYEQEEALEEALEPQQEKASALMSEAMRRINKAKLYETLISHNLFGDTDNEVVAEVQTEIQQFVLVRLNELLGIKQESTSEVIANNQFTQEEAEFLKALAQRGLTKSVPAGLTPVPTVVPAQVRAATINPVNTSKTIPVQKTQPIGKNVKVTPDGQRVYRKQTVSKRAQPLPMPSADVSNAIMASMAEKGLVQASETLVGSGGGQMPTAMPMGGGANPLLNALIQSSIAKNANVKED